MQRKGLPAIIWFVILIATIWAAVVCGVGIWSDHHKKEMAPPSYSEIYSNTDYMATLKVTLQQKLDEGDQPNEDTSLLSGFVTDWENDYGKLVVVTAGHIYKEESGLIIKKIEVCFKNGQGPEELEIARINHDVDTAILVFKNKTFKFTGRLPKRGNSDVMKVGEDVIALGSPYGIPNYFSAGRVGRTDTDVIEILKAGFYTDFRDCPLIAHSAATNPGCSGGPLLNTKGEIVGIHSMLLGSPDGSHPAYAPISISIPINYVILTLHKP